MQSSMAPQIQPPDNSSLPANRDEWKGLATSAAHLEMIFILTPVPTIVLNSSLRIYEVSDSHLSLTNLTREHIVGCSIFNIPLSTIPISSLPILLGSKWIALSTKAVQLISQPLGSPSLTMTPIFAASSFTYLIIEVIQQ
jgi:osomolarity two-component system sensor histidine kinase TcsA